MMLRLLPLALLLPFAISTTDDADAIREHLKVVRDRRITLSEKVPAMEALIGLGANASRQLASVLDDELKKLRQDFEKNRERFVKRFADAAPRVASSRLSRAIEDEVDVQRKIVRKNSRDPNLTKDMVKAESDPALARLAELLSVTSADIYAAEKGLLDDLFELLGTLEREKRIYEYWNRGFETVAGGEDGVRMVKSIGMHADPSELDNVLFDELDDITFMATPMRDSDRAVFVENEALADELDPEELNGVLRLNLIRVRCGLNALKIDVKLCKAARGHSKDMKELGFFSHTSPVEGKETFGQRASLEGTSANAENIAAGQGTGAGAIEAWWYSPGHHRNMMGGGSRIGLGRFESHWTQLFGG